MYQGFDPNQQKQTYQPEQNRSEYSWQGDYYNTYRQPVYQQAAVPVKKKSGGKTLLIVLAAILCCALVSAATLGTFIALINNGTLTLTNTGTAASPAYTITKLISSSETQEEEGSSAPAGSVSKLSVQAIAAKTLPSIVCIQNYQLSTGNSFFSFFGQQQQDSSNLTPYGEGSGIIASEDGYIITNAHVVEGANALKVVTYDGNTYDAQLIGSDTATDLAVVKIEASGLTAAEFGSSSDLQVGDLVVAAGNPGGMEFGFSTTVGYISALNRTVSNTSTGFSMDCIQTDAAVNPGNSGGALVNEYGQVVGIVSSKIVSEAYEGLSFAIPIDTAQGIVSDLKAFGYVKDRAVLGITGLFVDSYTARFYGLSTGWYIGSVSNESLSKAGVQKGDVITALNGTAISSNTTLSTLLLSLKPGDTVTLSIARASDNTAFDVQVILEEYTNE